MTYPRSEFCIFCGNKNEGESRLFCGRLCRRKTEKKLKEQNERAKKAGAFGRLGMKDWADALIRSNFSCSICGRNRNGTEGRNRENDKTRFSIDHVIPMDKGGFNLGFNIQCLCVKCHEKKDRSINSKRSFPLALDDIDFIVSQIQEFNFD